MRAKDVAFEVTYIDLRDKPGWFLDVSPHGKVPVLTVDGRPLFESNAIAEFLDEAVPPRLHPEDPIERARHRAWTDFVPDFARAFGAIYYAKSEPALAEARGAAAPRVDKLERAIAAERSDDGPYFGGDRLCLVDAAYAPFLQRFAFVEPTLRTGLLDGFPLVRGWWDALAADDRITGSVAPVFEREFAANLARRGALAAAPGSAAAAAE